MVGVAVFAVVVIFLAVAGLTASVLLQLKQPPEWMLHQLNGKQVAEAEARLIAPMNAVWIRAIAAAIPSMALVAVPHGPVTTFRLISFGATTKAAGLMMG